MVRKPKSNSGSKEYENYYPVEVAADEFFARLTTSDVPLPFTNFDDFVQNVFAKSYPGYDFNTWHVRLIATKVEEAFNSPDNPYLLAVLPRYHLKSSILGYASSVYRMLKSHGEGLYISYKEDLANIHSYHIKRAINDNLELSKIMTDLSPQSDSLINYKIGKKQVKIYTSGILAVKRGLHADCIVIGDDLMGDVLNPMLMTDIEKTKKLFDAEIMQIPNPGCPFFVYGTIISYEDLFFYLKDKPRFGQRVIWMPAEHPDEEHEVLWEAKYPMSWLKKQKEEIGWKAYNTEFMLVPVLSTQAFFTKDQLDPVIMKGTNYAVPGF
jgi:hypothetical protein